MFSFSLTYSRRNYNPVKNKTGISLQAGYLYLVFWY